MVIEECSQDVDERAELAKCYVLDVIPDSTKNLLTVTTLENRLKKIGFSKWKHFLGHVRPNSKNSTKCVLNQHKHVISLRTLLPV